MKKGLFLLSLFLTLFCGLEGKLFDHLKKAPGKNPALHKMKNIDFIYMINLDKRPEKFEKSLKQLKPYGITPYRFSAVNGWELSLETINDIGVKLEPKMDMGFMGTCYITDDRHGTHQMISKIGRTYFVHCFARGTMGICLSHLSVLQDAYDSGYETIWVMEDDIEVLQDPRMISDLIEKLDQRRGKGNWDILFTDRDFRNRQGGYTPCTGYARRPNYRLADPSRFAINATISKDFRRVGGRFGATSMIIRRSGMKKLLDFFYKYQIFLPYDTELGAPPNILLFTVQQDVVSNLRDAISNNGEAI